MPEWFQCEGIDAVLDRRQAAGASALIAFAHSCGPPAGVQQRVAISRNAPGHPRRLWINRYGYLSHTKLADLARLQAGTGAPA